MDSGHLLNVSQAMEYFSHEMDYYTKKTTNRDMWRGALAEVMGLKGEVKEAQFKALLEEIEKRPGVENVAYDITFSAPKGVSLAMAKDEATKADMLEAHRRAVEYIVDKIETEYLFTRSKGQKINQRNCACAMFNHQLARPTERNGYVPDLDLHTHCVFLNLTQADGKLLSQDFSKIINKVNFKRLGLMYRIELAGILQEMGYPCVVTDAKQGFFDLAGIPQEIIKENSNRRQEMESYAKTHEDINMQEVNKQTRLVKSKAKMSYEEVENQKHRDYFQSGIINIQKHTKGDIRYGRDESTSQSKQDRNREGGYSRAANGQNRSERRKLKHIKPWDKKPRSIVYVNLSRRVLTEIGSAELLPRLWECKLDPRQIRPDLLLSKDKLHHLSGIQKRVVQSLYMRNARAEDSRRRDRITEIAKQVIAEMGDAKYAFKLIDAKDEIMRRCILLHITEAEAMKAIEDAGAINIGRRIDREGKKKDNNVYLSIAKNIENDREFTTLFKEGQGAMSRGVMNETEARELLDRVEDDLHREGKSDFYISGKGGKKGRGGEQGEAIIDALTSNNQVLVWQGKAGTGKTTSLERMKLICDQQGVELIGLSFTGKAAAGLEAESGIKSYTMHSYFNSLEQGKVQETDLINEASLRNADIKTITDHNANGKTRVEKLCGALKENAVEIISNGKGQLNENIPKRTMSQKAFRAFKEICAEALLPAKDANALKAKYRADDRKLLKAQQSGAEIPAGANDKPLTAKEFAKSFMKGIGDNIADAFHIPAPEKEKHAPKRSLLSQAVRTGKEILAEAFLPADDARRYIQSLENEDERLYRMERDAKEFKKEPNDFQQSPRHTPDEDEEEPDIKKEWDFSSVKQSKRPKIYVIDEAGLLNTNLALQALKAAKAEGAKVVFIGDIYQLASIGAGEPMRKLIEELGATTSYLSDIRRQKDKALLEAVVALSSPDQPVQIAFDYFSKRGLAGERKDAMRKISKDIEKHPEDLPDLFNVKNTPLLAYSDAERKQQNAVYREELKKRMKIGPTETTIKTIDGTRQIAEGEYIVFRDDQKIIQPNGETVKIDRGQKAIVEKIEGDNITISFKDDEGRQKTAIINRKEINSIDYAYSEKAKLFEMRMPTERKQQAVNLITENRNIDQYKNAILLVDTNAERRDYNQAIRKIYEERGEIGEGVEFKIKDTTDKPKTRKQVFSLNERIVFTANDSKLNVKNGMLGTITAIDAKKRTITVKMDIEALGEIVIDMNKYKSIDYAYALTQYKSQGITIDIAISVMDTAHHHDRNSLYVGSSRARYEAYVITDDWNELQEQTREFAEKANAKDFERGEEIEQRGISVNDIYKSMYNERERLERAEAGIIEHTENALSYEEREVLEKRRKEWKADIEHSPEYRKAVNEWRAEQLSYIHDQIAKTHGDKADCLTLEEWKATFPPPKEIAERFEWDKEYIEKRYKDEYRNRYFSEAKLVKGEAPKYEKSPEEQLKDLKEQERREIQKTAQKRKEQTKQKAFAQQRTTCQKDLDAILKGDNTSYERKIAVEIATKMRENPNYLPNEQEQQWIADHIKRRKEREPLTQALTR